MNRATKKVTKTVRKDNKGRVLRTGETQSADGRYRYNYINASGIRTSKTSWRLLETDPQPPNKPNCECLRVLEKQVERDALNGKVVLKTTVSELTTNYLNNRYYNSPNTEISYKTSFNKIKNEKFLKNKVTDVTIADAKKWFYYLASKKGKKRDSLITLQAIFRGAFNPLYESDSIAKNPFDFRLTKEVIGNQTKNTKVTLTSEQCKSYLDFLKSHKRYDIYYDLMNTLFCTGLRIGELAALTIDDIDLENNIINIDKQIQPYSGKSNNKGTCFYIKAPKSDNSVRQVVITGESLKASLKNAIRLTKSRVIQPKLDGYTNFLFVTRASTPTNGKKGFLSSLAVNNRIKNTVKAYNDCHNDKLPIFTAHCCRHTYATKLINDGVPVEVVQAQLGHSSYKITMDTYVEKQSQHIKSELQKFSDYC